MDNLLKENRDMPIALQFTMFLHFLPLYGLKYTGFRSIVNQKLYFLMG